MSLNNPANDLDHALASCARQATMEIQQLRFLVRGVVIDLKHDCLAAPGQACDGRVDLPIRIGHDSRPLLVRDIACSQDAHHAPDALPGLCSVGGIVEMRMRFHYARHRRLPLPPINWVAPRNTTAGRTIRVGGLRQCRKIDAVPSTEKGLCRMGIFRPV